MAVSFYSNNVEADLLIRVIHIIISFNTFIMITPEEQYNEEEKKTVYKETTDENDDLTSGETSTPSTNSAFTRQPERKNGPLGSSHEPGVTPGREF